MCARVVPAPKITQYTIRIDIFEVVDVPIKNQTIFVKVRVGNKREFARSQHKLHDGAATITEQANDPPSRTHVPERRGARAMDRRFGVGLDAFRHSGFEAGVTGSGMLICRSTTLRSRPRRSKTSLTCSSNCTPPSVSVSFADMLPSD
jgi:hypothetical protein